MYIYVYIFVVLGVVWCFSMWVCVGFGDSVVSFELFWIYKMVISFVDNLSTG